MSGRFMRTQGASPSGTAAENGHIALGSQFGSGPGGDMGRGV
jgi:hypothetical protein